MPMECGDVRERLDALSTGELDLAAREPVERHLETCESCRRAFVRLRSLAAFLRDAPVPPVPAGFAARVAAGRAAAGASWNPLRRWPAMSVPARAAAVLVAAAGLLAGTLMGWKAGAPGGDRDPGAASLETHYPDFLGDVPESSMVQAFRSLTEATPEGRRQP